MKNYFELLKYLKVCYQNISVLHRHIVGETFFVNHEILKGYYDYIGDMGDDLIEIGMSVGVTEPTIDESVETYETIPTNIGYTCLNAFEMVKSYFNSLLEILELAKMEVTADIKNKLEEYEYYLRKEANYKIKQFLGGGEND